MKSQLLFDKKEISRRKRRILMKLFDIGSEAYFMKCKKCEYSTWISWDYLDVSEKVQVKENSACPVCNKNI